MAIKKLTKAEIVEYYHRLSYPEQYNLDFVPIDMQLKSFEKLLKWQGISEPETKNGNINQKFILEIKESD